MEKKKELREFLIALIKFHDISPETAETMAEVLISEKRLQPLILLFLKLKTTE